METAADNSGKEVLLLLLLTTRSTTEYEAVQLKLKLKQLKLSDTLAVPPTARPYSYRQHDTNYTATTTDCCHYCYYSGTAPNTTTTHCNSNQNYTYYTTSATTTAKLRLLLTTIVRQDYRTRTGTVTAATCYLNCKTFKLQNRCIGISGWGLRLQSPRSGHKHRLSQRSVLSGSLRSSFGRKAIKMFRVPECQQARHDCGVVLQANMSHIVMTSSTKKP